MQDVIGALAAKQITLVEADARVEHQQERWRRGEIDDWPQEVGMSYLESTANADGASLDMLARLRRDGWPEACCRCGGPIDYLRDPWMFTVTADGNDPLLLHLPCPGPPLALPLCPEDPDVTMYNFANDDPQVRAEREELERVLERLRDDELDVSQVIGYIESAYDAVLTEAMISAYERVYGRSPQRARPEPSVDP